MPGGLNKDVGGEQECEDGVEQGDGELVGGNPAGGVEHDTGDEEGDARSCERQCGSSRPVVEVHAGMVLGGGTGRRVM